MADPHPALRRLDGASRSTQVRQELEDAIARGVYGPGDRLPSERELASRLGVSRVSVREALGFLRAVSKVEVRRGAGCFVSDDSTRNADDLAAWIARHRDEVLELMLVRRGLEELAAEETALRGTDAALARVRTAHERFLAAIDADSGFEHLTTLDIAFHQEIATASGSALLSGLLADLHERLSEPRRAAFAPDGRAARSGAEHATIVRALERRDGPAARRAVARPLARVRALLEQVAEAPGEASLDIRS